MLWKIASGSADYREVLREMCGFGVLRSVALGAVVTLRNVVFELLLGLKWGKYGRYPTVVLNEKRGWVKERLVASLGTEVGESPDFERMYVIKIRAGREQILQQLAAFGAPQACFLNMRFLEVRRTQGEPNQVGAVIRYGLRLGGPGAELCLTKRVSSETVFYRFEERLANDGKLIFNIAPTRDGNNRLTIYAAFDFKRGKRLAAWAFWKCFRVLFPGFLHDLVWNHGLCAIKEEAERKHNAVPLAR